MDRRMTRYSECLRRIAPHLAQHKSGREMLRLCAEAERMEGCEDSAGWTVAEAVYWLGADYHDGQASPLYAALCQTLYNPGMGASKQGGPETDSAAHMLYLDLVPLAAGVVFMKWSLIRQRYAHGYSAADGTGRMAEVIRTDSCGPTWEVFAYRNGRMVQTGRSGPTFGRMHEAKRAAIEYLTTGMLDGLDVDACPLAQERTS